MLLCRLEVLSHIFQQSIASNYVFRGNEDLVEYMIPMLEMKVFLPEDMIIRQGEEGSEMFFIATGDCSVFVKDTMRNERFVQTLARGDFFGEVAMSRNCRRTASVKSKNYCVTAMLHRKDFTEIVERFPDFHDKLKRHSVTYKDDLKMQLKGAIMRTSYLKSLPDEIVDDMIYALRQEQFENKNVVFREGEICKGLLFVMEGGIELSNT